MSFYQYPVAGFLGGEIHVSIPESTIIKEDFLVSFTELEKIKYKIKENDLRLIPDQINNIIRVYNCDIEFINHAYRTFEAREFQSFESFCKYRGNDPIESLQKEYEAEKNIAGIRTAQQRNKLCQLKQLGGLSSTLAEKITRTVERLKRCDAIAEQIPPCRLVELAFDDRFLAPSLRRIEEPVKKSQAAALEPVALTQDQNPEAFAAIETVVSATYSPTFFT